jgi:hypothetical protein
VVVGLLAAVLVHKHGLSYLLDQQGHPIRATITRLRRLATVLTHGD